MDLFFQDTICAVSTAPGVGGIAVVRVSGRDALSLCARFLSFDPATVPANTCRYARFTRLNGKLLDEVMVSVFRVPHSFTGEDTVEIACHGSLYIQQCILQELVAGGARFARAGEFTQRAFLNGKMDLSQAEAVADLIASRSRSAHRLALNQMRGGFSDELSRLRDKLLTFTSLIELELDFADHEELEFADRTQLSDLANDIEQKIHRLVDSFSVGNAIKNGIPVAIVGATNAGKSTLLNALVGEERAIVSDIHGTTRDIIEDSVMIRGVQFRFIDTAGLRQTDDTIESLGIERSYNAIAKSDIVLLLLDASQIENVDKKLVAEIAQKSADKHLILVFNKADKLSEQHVDTFKTAFSDITAKRISISAKERQNIDQLQELIFAAAQLPEIGENDVTVASLRHYEALTHAHEAILRVIDGLACGISGDFLSQDLRECLNYLGEITGQITTKEVLGNIFSKFCVGK